MNAKLALVSACAAILATMAAKQTIAQELAGSSRLHPLNLEQGREAGIQLVAKSFGLSLDAARSRMNVEEHAPDIVERIRNQYADRLAGIYIEHAPTHRLIVRLTGFEAVPSETYLFGDDVLTVNYHAGAAHSLADLQQRFENGFASVRQRMPGLQSGYVDERTGEIVLEVVASREPVGHVAMAQDQSSDAGFGVATRMVAVDAPLANQAIKGSGNLDFNTSDQCTGAFTVKSVSTPVTYGLLTAGHCQSTSGSFTYTEAGTSSPTTTLSFVASKYDAASDVSWASVSTNSSDAVNSFYNGTSFVTAASRLTKAGTSVGMSLCHYGRSTSSSGGVCGTVQSTAYNPGSICGPSGSTSCSATYVAVDVSTSTPCQQIDSGGPWFTSTAKPAGIHKAGNVTTGRCVYTSTDDVIGGTLNLLLL